MHIENTLTRGSAGGMFRRVACLLLAAALIAQLLTLGAQPGAAGLFPEPWDKLAHAALFSVLAALLWLASDGRMPATVVVAVLAVGLCDELAQANLPGRTADALDLLTDACAALGTVALMQLRARPPGRSACAG
jgi:VanZ family protein